MADEQTTNALDLSGVPLAALADEIRQRGHEVQAERKHADYALPPDPSRKAYATVRLDFNPQGACYVFEPGDEVQDVLPADVLANNIATGHVSYDAPEAS